MARSAAKPPAPGRGPEAELLLSCARTGTAPGGAARLDALVRRVASWDRFLGLARRHKVVPLVHQHLSAAPPGAVPAAVLGQLRDYAQANGRHTLLLSGELARLLRGLAAQGIPALPFKGPLLAELAYGSLVLREFADLDVLVPRDAVAVAQEVVRAQGYRVLQREFIPHNGEARSADVRGLPFLADFRLDYDYVLARRDGKARVELHWRFLPAYFFPFPLAWERLGEVSFAGAATHSLPPEDLLLLLCVHGTKHCWDRLQWICDVAELVRARQGIAWGPLREKAAALGGRRMLALGLLLAGDLLGAPVPGAVAAWVRADLAVRALARRVEARLFRETAGRPDVWDKPLPLLGHSPEGMSFHLRAKERLRDQTRYCLGLGLGVVLEAIRLDRVGERARYCAECLGLRARTCEGPTPAR
jgi:Uncharacterised nucleotidyltransferase